MRIVLPTHRRALRMFVVMFMLLAAMVAGSFMQPGGTSATATVTGNHHDTNEASRPQNIQPHPSMHPVPAVDGATNPDLIPDEVALSLFYRAATAEKGTAGLLVARSYLSSMLVLTSRDDTQGALDIVREFRPQMDTFDLRVRQNRQNPAERQTIAIERAVALSAFSAALSSRLGPEGDQKLANALLRVKKHTRLFRR